MRRLEIGAYRLFVAWPRILPAGRGTVNAAEAAFYDRLVEALLEAGIEPWLCLYHWDLPQALDDRGGWISRDCALWFADYVAVVARRFGDRVKQFATFDEPSVFTLLGYALGSHGPGIADRTAHLRAIHHVNLGHGAGAKVLRSLVPTASIGAIHNYQPSYPSRIRRRTPPPHSCSTRTGIAHFRTRSFSPAIRRRSPTQSNLISKQAIWRPSAIRSTGSASIITRRSIARPILVHCSVSRSLTRRRI
jgi:hypothetical protein